MGIERRLRRQQERDKLKIIKKVHSEFMDNIKGLSNEEIMAKIENYKTKYGYNNQSNAEAEANV